MELLGSSTGIRTPRKLKHLIQSSVLISPSTRPPPIPTLSASKSKISSPSILSYFGKSPSAAAADRPMFAKSPRKLILSPSKTLRELEIAGGNDLRKLSGVKRKLCSDDDSDDICVENMEGLRCSKVPKSYLKNSPSIQSASPVECKRESQGKVLSPSKINNSMTFSSSDSDTKCGNENKSNIENVGNEKVSCQRLLSEIFHPSLTFNLPKYSVAEFQCPSVSSQEVKSGRTVDWLTQIRISHQKKSGNLLIKGTLRASNKTPVRKSSSSKRDSTIPKSSKV